MLERPDKFAEIARPAVDVPDEFLSKKGLADKILKEKATKRDAEQASTTKRLAIQGSSKRSSRCEIHGQLMYQPFTDAFFKFIIIGYKFFVRFRFRLGLRFVEFTVTSEEREEHIKGYRTQRTLSIPI
jgi:hypothetical protein